MKYSTIRKEAERRVEAGSVVDMAIFNDGFESAMNGSKNHNPYRFGGIVSVESAIFDLGVEAAFIGMYEEEDQMFDEFAF